MSKFQELLADLQATTDASATMAKGGEAANPAQPDDAAVAAAAAEAGVQPPAGNPEDDDLDADGEGKDGDETLGKSLGTNADGEDLVDATELVKSLMGRLDTHDDTLTKALTSVAGTLKSQATMIKSLQDQVQALGRTGAGRKTLVAVLPKVGMDELAKGGAADDGAAGQITPSELMAKSNAAYAAGKISGQEFNTVDVCLRNRMNIDPGLLVKIAGA